MNYADIQDDSALSKKSKKDFVQNPEVLEQYKKEKNFKFLVDNMLQKLATQLRNCGYDAEFCGEKFKTPTQKVRFAEEDNRILLTKGRNVMLMKKTCPLIKLVNDRPMGNPLSNL
jgi:uncharacterized protein with PIN domain